MEQVAKEGTGASSMRRRVTWGKQGLSTHPASALRRWASVGCLEFLHISSGLRHKPGDYRTDGRVAQAGRYSNP